MRTGKSEKPRYDVNECAAKKLARKSMSRKELLDYLVKKGYEKEESEEAVGTLIDLGYINDANFARDFIAYDIGRNRSKRKIVYDLKRKGVSDEDIEKGYSAYLEEFGEPDEHELAYKEALKVLAAAELAPHEIPDEMKRKIEGRIARRLFTRGFPQTLIYEILSEIR